MAKQTELIRVLKSIPPKWALGIIGVLIAYWLLQPVANRTFGWSLPSLAAIVNNDLSLEAKKPTTAPKKVSPKSDLATKSVSSASKSSSTRLPTDVEPKSKPSESKPSEPKSSKSPSKNNASDPATNSDTNGSPTYGYLKSIGRDRYESPEGLVYAPGSEEGHRLKHIERHTADIPNRPGSHGVFEGTMTEFLSTIDRGYRLALSKAKGTKTREEDGMTVLEITFDKKIGFVGGADGRKKGTPSTKRLRIVLNGDRLITAFPY